MGKVKQTRRKLAQFFNWRCSVTLTDGRVLVGILMAVDKHVNLVLCNTEEYRRYKVRGKPEGKELKRMLGLITLRGETVLYVQPEDPGKEDLVETDKPRKVKAGAKAAGPAGPLNVAPGGAKAPGMMLPPALLAGMRPGGALPGLAGLPGGAGGLPALNPAMLAALRPPGGGGIPGMTGQKKDIVIQDSIGVRFDDVAGIDEAKEELTEVVDFLRKPERFVKVGAKIPKGVLLTGPPGTGKTLMAKALAGESGVPFIQSSASEFIELFVGVGASRVRDIFKQAKEKAPCIVFIDEIDAIGRQRGSGMGGGNDEREQTLNQILTEMDGFGGNTGVIVVAATNRSDILDSALLRPGRFDRRVEVGLPDVKGREQILKVHLKNKKLEEDVSIEDVAKRCTGMSGADLENLMNESAILAARRKKKAISQDEIFDATDRVVAGIQGTALASNAQKKVFAYHEAGKALVGTMLAYHDPVAKVTLIPRGQRKSLTWFTPEQDQSLIGASSLKARIAGFLGGRAAEQVVFGDSQVTSCAGGDLQQVDRVARAMVTQVGMSSVGQLTIDQGGMLGPSYSEDLAGQIDDAIKELSDEGYLVALNVISKNRDCLDELADELFERETLTGAQITEIIERYTQIPEKLSAV